MVKTKIACPCSMETHLVLIDGKWHYDVDKHGNGEPAEGKCFNCRAPLKMDDGPAEGPVVPDEKQPKAISEMTKKELYEHAKDLGLKVAWTASRAKILEIIEAKDKQPETGEAEQPETGEDEQPKAAEDGQPETDNGE